MAASTGLKKKMLKETLTEGPRLWKMEGFQNYTGKANPAETPGRSFGPNKGLKLRFPTRDELKQPDDRPIAGAKNDLKGMIKNVMGGAKKVLDPFSLYPKIGKAIGLGKKAP